MTVRIVVEPGGYNCLNMGDVAMMQVAVSRLNEAWPEALVEVVTANSDLLARYCPTAVPILVETRDSWLSGRSLIGGLHGRLPVSISLSIRTMEQQLWMRHPDVADAGVRLKTKLLHGTPASPSSFRKCLTAAGLLVVSGMGVLNDAFADSACSLLDEAEIALRAGIPVVAFGQGVGPISNPALLARARAVLPRLALIGLREGRSGLPLLASLGVPRDRIHVTGDDAIELAYRLRPDALGDAIGINVRIADYVGFGENILDVLRAPLLDFGQAVNASFCPAPVSLLDRELETRTMGRLLDDQGQDLRLKINGPEDVIREIGKVRLMVTTSYHGGVFALAQGIPVVALLTSDYYEQKFTGLQAQFPGGCRILDFRQPVSSRDIQETLRDAWDSAGRVRESLLMAAAEQVELTRGLYDTARRQIPLRQ